MEFTETIMMQNLQHTMHKNKVLMDDLSKKSVSMTNQLVARNPIHTPTVKYPGHSQYSYRKKNLANAKKEYEIKLLDRVMKNNGVYQWLHFQKLIEQIILKRSYLSQNWKRGWHIYIDGYTIWLI